jgi:hypothetical protein
MQEVAFFVLIALFAVGSMIWHSTRSQDILQHWADQNGYRIIEKKYVQFFRGPFFWTSSKGQSVYRVVVEDRTGRRRSGWVRCGSWWLGVWIDQAQVHWDD